MKRAASSSSRQASMEPSSFLDSLHPPARQRSGSTSAESLLPPRTFSRSNSVASSSQGGSLLNQRREVSMRRSVSVQRDINGKGKGKEVAQPNGKSSSTATLKAKTKPGKSAETRVAKSASFSASAPNLRPGESPILQLHHERRVTPNHHIPQMQFKVDRTHWHEQTPPLFLKRPLILGPLGGRPRSTTLEPGVGLHKSRSTTTPCYSTSRRTPGLRIAAVLFSCRVRLCDRERER